MDAALTIPLAEAAFYANTASAKKHQKYVFLSYLRKKKVIA